MTQSGDLYWTNVDARNYDFYCLTDNSRYTLLAWPQKIFRTWVRGMRCIPTMRLSKFALFSACVLGAALPAVGYTHARRVATPAKHAAKAKFQVPRGIDDDRATQLQTALIHAGYLTGTPSGHWDDQTQAAMQKLQADNGWQTKLVPDSRAIIKLGLGPSTAYDSSASETAAVPAQSAPPAQ